LAEPVDDLLVYLAVPFLVAAVRRLVLCLGDEAFIARFVQSMEDLMVL
jgi:hypothetical protein